MLKETRPAGAARPRCRKRGRPDCAIRFRRLKRNGPLASIPAPADRVLPPARGLVKASPVPGRPQPVATTGTKTGALGVDATDGGFQGTREPGTRGCDGERSPEERHVRRGADSAAEARLPRRDGAARRLGSGGAPARRGRPVEAGGGPSR